MEKIIKDLDYKQAYYELVNVIGHAVLHDLSHVAGGKRFYEPVAQELLAAVNKSKELVK